MSTADMPNVQLPLRDYIRMTIEQAVAPIDRRLAVIETNVRELRGRQPEADRNTRFRAFLSGAWKAAAVIVACVASLASLAVALLHH